MTEFDFDMNTAYKNFVTESFKQGSSCGLEASVSDINFVAGTQAAKNYFEEELEVKNRMIDNFLDDVLSWEDRLHKANDQLKERHAEYCANMTGQEHRLGSRIDALQLKLKIAEDAIALLGDHAFDCECCCMDYHARMKEALAKIREEK